MHAVARAMRYLGPTALVGWFGGMVVLCAGLLARHLVALPLPTVEDLGARLAAERSSAEKHQWLAIHVLYSDCRCSLRVADHLAHSERPTGFSEVVLWVGSDPPAPEIQARFDVRRVTAAELSALGVEAAPSFFILDPDDHVRYAGGYTDRKQGPVIDDLRILRATRAAEPVTAFPVFGCAVSDRLKDELAVLPTP